MKLISVPEAAARIGCSRGHVYHLIQDGLLARHDISRPGSARSKVRLSDEDVDRFIAGSLQPVRKAAS